MLSLLFFHNYLLSSRSGALVRMIAWLSMIGVALGVAALIIVLSVMNGFNRTIRERMFVVEPHVVIPLARTQTWVEVSLTDKIPQALGPQIESVYPFESRDVIVRSGEGAFSGSVAKGYPGEAIEALLKRVWRQGTQATPEPMTESARLASDELIVGAELAHNLNVIEGDEVLLVPPENLLLPKGEIPKFQKFKVRMILASQLPEVDGQMVLYALPDALESAPKISASAERGYEIRLVDPYRYAPVVAEIQRQGLKGIDWTQRNTSLFFALKMEKMAMTVFLSLAVLITSFSIVTVMALVMSRKRRDIAMMMAMGFSEKRTKRLFLRIGLLLAACGIGSGTFIGVVTSVVLHLHPLEILPDIYQDTSLPVDPSWSLVLGVLVGAGALAVIGAWLPVARVRSLSPSQNLRA